MPWHGPLLFLGRIVALGAVSLLLAEAAARIGAGILRFLTRRRTAPLERLGYGLLLGWSATGTAYLGAGLLGLFSPSVLGGWIVLGVAVTALAGQRRWLTVEALEEVRRQPRAGILAAAAGCLPLLPHLVVPEFDYDAGGYHLGAPWRYLLSHRVLIEHLPVGHHFPAPVDLAFALPLAIGDERLAKWIVASCLFAAAGVVVASLGRDGRRHGWLVVLWSLPGVALTWYAYTAKNDLPAAAMFVAGCAASIFGRRLLGAALLGAALAAKPVYAPAIAVWFAAVLPFRSWRRALPLAAIPVLPWLAKAFLAFGNPLHPLTAAWLPAWSWTGANRAVYVRTIAPLWEPGSDTVAGLLPAWLRSLFNVAPLHLVLVPAALAWGRRRRELAALAVGSLLILGAGRYARYLLPAVWMMSVLLVAQLPAVPSRRRRAAAGLLAGAALLLAALSPSTRPAAWREACLPADNLLDAGLTTRRAAVSVIAGLPGPLPRIVHLGEFRVDRYRARLLCGGLHGETPLVWNLVHASRGPRDVAKRFRQIGAGYLLDNVVGRRWIGGFYAGTFPWNDRMLSTYEAFARARLELIASPGRIDLANGGHFLFRVRRSAAPPAARLAHLPGAETALPPAGAPGELQTLERLAGRHPRVLDFSSRLGHLHAEAGRWRLAYAALKPTVEAGLVDDVNIPAFGHAAYALGRLDEAESAYRLGLDRYPDYADAMRVGLGGVECERASQALETGRAALAGAHVERARAHLAFRARVPGIEAERRARLEFADALRSAVERRRTEVAP